MKYVKLKEFIKKNKTSKSSLYRFYNKYPELFAETKLKGGRRLIPQKHTKYFNNEILLEENRKLLEENSSLTRLIYNLKDKNKLEHRLWNMDWTYFITIAPKNELRIDLCSSLINQLYNELIHQYGEKTTINLFYTIEHNNDRNGHHMHMFLFVKSKSLHDAVIEIIEDYFQSDRIDIQQYDMLKAGIYYISKKGLTTEGWDILLSEVA